MVSIDRLACLLLSGACLVSSSTSLPAFVLPALPSGHAAGRSISPTSSRAATGHETHETPPASTDVSADAPSDPAAAVPYFHDITERYPSDAVAHLNLGVALRRLGEPTLSHGALLRATELKPDDAQSWYQLGVTSTEMGIVDEAAEAFRRVLALRPPRSDDSDVKGGGGVVVVAPNPAEVALANVLLDGKGEKKGARRVFEGACASGPGPVSLLAGLAAGSCGDLAAARRYLEDAISFNPYDVDAAVQLMACRHLEGDDVGAAEMRRRLPDDVKSSWDYILEVAPELVSENPASLSYFTHDMMKLAMDAVDIDEGLLLEFGVFHGKTIRMIASQFPDETVHGFDTFSGLPEDWRGTSRGAYSTQGRLPLVPANVHFHVGLFADTLPAFLHQNPGHPVRLMNIDCDLYSSTKDVFDAVHDRVVPGTVIVFDEYVMNPHWRDDEFKAFQEAVKENGWTYKYIGISLATGQAAVQIQ